VLGSPTGSRKFLAWTVMRLRSLRPSGSYSGSVVCPTLCRPRGAVEPTLVSSRAAARSYRSARQRRSASASSMTCKVSSTVLLSQMLVNLSLINLDHLAQLPSYLLSGLPQAFSFYQPDLLLLKCAKNSLRYRSSDHLAISLAAGRSIFANEPQWPRIRGATDQLRNLRQNVMREILRSKAIGQV
jgi:hypothetical protein